MHGYRRPLLHPVLPEPARTFAGLAERSQSFLSVKQHLIIYLKCTLYGKVSSILIFLIKLLLLPFLNSEAAQDARLSLLSDLIHDILDHYIAQLYKVGDNRNAEKLEMHLYLLEDARVGGIEPAWQTVTEDFDEEDEGIDEEDIE